MHQTPAPTGLNARQSAPWRISGMNLSPSCRLTDHAADSMFFLSKSGLFRLLPTKFPEYPGNLGADGNLYVVLPDNDPDSIRVSTDASGRCSFTFNAQKYTVGITANGNDLSVTNPTFCVGQKISLAISWTPAPPPFASAIYHWHLPPKYVNEVYQYSSACNSYTNDPALLTYSTNQCWYVNGNGGACSLSMRLQFANGQIVYATPPGRFSVFRPQVTFPFPSTGITPMIPMLTNGWLQLGNATAVGGDDTGTLSYIAKITSRTGLTGVANWTQLLKRSATYPDNATDTAVRYDLDTSQLYNNISPAITNLASGVFGGLFTIVRGLAHGRCGA